MYKKTIYYMFFRSIMALESLKKTPRVYVEQKEKVFLGVL